MIDYFKNFIFLVAYQIPTKFDDNSAADFYNAWHKAGYLKSGKVFGIELIGMFKNMFLLLFYNITSSMENIFNAMLKIFGIYNEMDKGAFHDIRFVVFGLGLATVGFSLAMLAISQIWGKGDKYLKGLKSAVMFTSVIIILPFFVSNIGNITGAGAKEIGYGSGTTSMAMEPIKDNIIDVTKLNESAFQSDPNTLDPAKYNSFNDNNIASVDFGSIVAESNTKKVSKPVKDILNHQVKGNTVSDNQMPSKDSGGVLKSFDDAYQRYSGQFFIAILTEGVLALFLLVMAFRVGKSVYQILITTLAAPIVLYTNLQRPSRLKDIISAVIGSMVAVWSEIISVKVFIIIASTLNNNPAVRALGTGGFELGVLKLVILASSFAGFLFGVQLIERWTGVPNGSGHGMLGFMLGGALASKAAVGGIKGTVGTSKDAYDIAKGTAQSARSLGSKVKNGMKSLGNGISVSDSNGLSSQSRKEAANPALKVGNNKPTDKNDNPTTNVDSNQRKVNDNTSKGTDESSIDSGNSLDNNSIPTSDIEDNNGTDQNSINDNESNNRVNPTRGVGDESSKGTNNDAIDDNGSSKKTDPANKVGKKNNAKTTPVSKYLGGSSGFNKYVDAKKFNGSSSNSLSDDLNEKLDNIGKNNNDINVNPAQNAGDNQSVSDKVDNLSKQMEKNAKANKPKFGDRLQDTANSLSRIQQETDKPSINPPSDEDEF